MILLSSAVLGLVFTVFWIWAVLDVIGTDESDIRSLPKLAWLALVILVPLFGVIGWFALGRPARSRVPPPRRRTIGPEDRGDHRPPDQRPSLPDDERARRLQAWEDDLARRERELRRREGEAEAG